jgi:hypothetical protein
MLPISELVLESEGQFKVVVACRNWAGPIKQEGDVLRLGPLLHPADAGAAEALLRRPLESLGAVFEQERDLSRILVDTGYNPNLVQDVGQGLLAHLDDQPRPAEGERPAYRLGPAEVDAVLSEMGEALAAAFRAAMVHSPHAHLVFLLLAVPEVAEQYAGAAGAGLRPAELVLAATRYWPIGFVGPPAYDEAGCLAALDGLVLSGAALLSATGRYFLAEARWARAGSAEEMRAELDAFNATHLVNPDDVADTKAQVPASAPAPKLSMLKRLTNGRRSL